LDYRFSSWRTGTGRWTREWVQVELNAMNPATIIQKQKQNQKKQ
jgi:hypothetical protein